MKKLALVLDLNDAEWLAAVWANRNPAEELLVVAPNFNGRVVADSLGIPYKTYEDISWGLDKLAITDESRLKARYWHELDGIRNNAFIEAVREFNGYPLFIMCQSLLFLAVQEIIQAHRLIKCIISLEKPDQFIFNTRSNPFYCLPIFFIADCKTVEREVVKSYCMRNLPVNERLSAFLEGIQSIYPTPVQPGADLASLNWPDSFSGPKILIYAFGGYYFDYILNVLERLLLRKARICIVIMEGWELVLPFQQQLLDKGVYLVNRSSVQAANEEEIWKAWREKCKQAVESVYGSRQLEEYFSDEHGTYFPGLVSDFLCKQIVDNSSLVVDLMRAETFITGFAPDVVLYHANIHSSETCDILPARKLGIPTLAIDHGTNGYLDAQRMTFATEFYGVSGQCLKEGMLSALKAKESAIRVLGNTRCEKITPSMLTVREAKIKFGFDQERPVCIYCDQGGWSHTYEWRHSSYDSLNAVLGLKARFPELQIIYRIHHGVDENGKRHYLNQINDKDIYFQQSLNPILTEILPAADLVIAHYTSAVAETLLRGVPVIYITSHGEPEPSYFGCEAIHIAESFDELPQLVSRILITPGSHTDVRCLAQPFLDKVLAGNDGNASERLAEMIIKLAVAPDNKQRPGFQDWLDRINASANFSTKEFRKLVPLAKHSFPIQPFVSVIIPTYNRAKMIEATLESFINQTYPKGRFEIIVADNNSSDDTRGKIAYWQKISPVKITYLFVPRQGAHNARNAAAMSAVGEILYFTDDDMIADPDMLNELVNVFGLDENIGAATGRVLPKWELPPPEWVQKLCVNGYLSLNDQGNGIIIEPHDIGVYSCHQAVKREIFFRSGGFNPDIVNGIAIGDNEVGLNIKIMKIGFKFAYNGKSVTWHYIPPSRMTQEYLNRRFSQQGGCESYLSYREKRFTSDQLTEQIHNHHKMLTRHSYEALKKQTANDISWHIDQANVHYYLSRIYYDYKLLSDHLWREMALHDDWLNNGEIYDDLIMSFAPPTSCQPAQTDDQHIRINLKDFGYESGNRTDNLKKFQEKYGYSIIPVSYEEPVPDLRAINIHNNYRKDLLLPLDFRYDDTWINNEITCKLSTIPSNIIINPMTAKKDLEVYGNFISKFRPKIIIEIGSGYSGCFACFSNAIYGVNARIHCIEPSPNPFLTEAATMGKIHLIQKKIQDINIEEFKLISDLKSNDILYVDASHVTVRDSDTNYIFIKILPLLNSGVLVHFHDIFLPYDYIDNYYNRGWFWNEQYLLAAVLANSDRYQPLYSTYYNHVNGGGGYGGAFWMKVK